jgi:RND family efflux transporter MFP subunit
VTLTITRLIVFPVLIAGCGTIPRDTTAPPAPVAVSLAPVQLISLPSTFEAGGAVRARLTAPIASRIMTPVLEVHVRAGDRVRRGAPLVTLDGREAAANRTRAAAVLTGSVESVLGAQAALRSAEAAVTLARATHDRIRALHDTRSATTQELDQAVSALESADAQLGGARANLAAALAAQEAAQAGSEGAMVVGSYSVLAAPFDGVVTERSVDPGAMAIAGVPLLTIEDATSLQLEVALDEAHATRVAAGQTADVQLGDTASPDAWIQAKVSEVSRLDPASHSFLVKLDLPIQTRARSGSFGRARFVGSVRQTLAVPASAVVRRGQLTFVFTVDTDGRARLQPVSPGVATRDRLEVLAGVREGDRLVTSPPPSLADGARVTGARP